MFLAHKIEIRPNSEQVEFLKKCLGVRRFVWNACLAEWEHAYKHGLAPNEDYMRFYLKVLRERRPWISEVPSRVYYVEIRNLSDAFIKFFRKKSRYPRYKKKGQHESFTLDQGFKVSGRNLRIPNMKSNIKMRELLRFEGSVRQCTISTMAGKWFTSLLMEVLANPYTNKMPGENQVGVDLGVKDLAVLSDGGVFPANQPLKQKLKKLAKLQRRLAKKKKGSRRSELLKLRIAKLHYYVSCKRDAVTHGMTDFITRGYKQITIEDLNVVGMVKNRRLARAVSDVGMGEVRRQLEYKSSLRKCDLRVADRWFPSSKLCNQCGTIKQDLTLADRVYTCECGLSISRDLNAAINLLKYRPGLTQAGR